MGLIKKIFCIAAAGLFLLAAGCSAEARPAGSGISASAAVETQSPSPTNSPSVPAAQAATAAPTATPSATAGNKKIAVADGFYYMKLDDALKKRITGMSFPTEKNAKITYADLRYVGLKYYDFDGTVHTDGELIINAKLAEEVCELFHQLYAAKYPFTSVRLVDDFGEPGDDNLSMAANNTSAFNYRHVTGSQTLSLHSYGEAIDINPKLNPYIENGRVSPANGAKYADRTLHLPGMIDHADLCYRLFTKNGWTWGGDAAGDKDYQHFSKK